MSQEVVPMRQLDNKSSRLARIRIGRNKYAHIAKILTRKCFASITAHMKIIFQGTYLLINSPQSSRDSESSIVNLIIFVSYYTWLVYIRIYGLIHQQTQHWLSDKSLHFTCSFYINFFVCMCVCYLSKWQQGSHDRHSNHHSDKTCYHLV